MLIVSDVHGAVAALRRTFQMGETVLVLGDLINYIDYRTADGILADVAGHEWVAGMIVHRTAEDWDSVSAHWKALRERREPEDLRRDFESRIEQAYASICAAMTGEKAFVTFGNVDRPDRLEYHLPSSASFIKSGVIEVDGWSVGIVGGGVPSRMGVPGEVPDEVLAERLAAIGPVDILGTHVPPAIPQLSVDVVAGTNKGSRPVLDYVLEHQPLFHYFGDIHQPQAVSWRIGRTLCRNVGYFRATGRPVRHGDSARH